MEWYGHGPHSNRWSGTVTVTVLMPLGEWHGQCPHDHWVEWYGSGTNFPYLKKIDIYNSKFSLELDGMRF